MTSGKTWGTRFQCNCGDHCNAEELSLSLKAGSCLKQRQGQDLVGFPTAPFHFVCCFPASPLQHTTPSRTGRALHRAYIRLSLVKTDKIKEPPQYFCNYCCSWTHIVKTHSFSARVANCCFLYLWDCLWPICQIKGAMSMKKAHFSKSMIICFSVVCDT